MATGSETTEGRGHHLAYLLRLWEVRDGDRRIWRASLQSPTTSERHAFANLEDLFIFLEDRTAVLLTTSDLRGPCEKLQ
jgi:hypothetical protein